MDYRPCYPVSGGKRIFKYAQMVEKVVEKIIDFTLCKQIRSNVYHIVSIEKRYNNACADYEHILDFSVAYELDENQYRNGCNSGR